MSIKVGDRFGNFVVTKTMKDAVIRWLCYHETCNLANITEDIFDKNVLEAALEDEYNEMKGDDYIMGVGLYAYNEYLRQRA